MEINRFGVHSLPNYPAFLPVHPFLKGFCFYGILLHTQHNITAYMAYSYIIKNYKRLLHLAALNAIKTAMSIVLVLEPFLVILFL